MKPRRHRTLGLLMLAFVVAGCGDDADPQSENYGNLLASPGGLIVHPSMPVRKATDLVGLARARPGEIAFGSSGPGGGSHLGGELFNLLAKVKLLHVPYKGSALATVSVLSGETQVAFNNPTSSMPHIRAGRLRLVAVTTAQRWPNRVWSSSASRIASAPLVFWRTRG